MKSHNTFLRLFCQGIAPKNFACNAGKIFRALDKDDKTKSNHARSDTSLRVLITNHSLKTYVGFKYARLNFTSYSESVK